MQGHNNYVEILGPITDDLKLGNARDVFDCREKTSSLLVFVTIGILASLDAS